jgi:hypothetical protein
MVAPPAIQHCMRQSASAIPARRGSATCRANLELDPIVRPLELDRMLEPRPGARTSNSTLTCLTEYPGALEPGFCPCARTSNSTRMLEPGEGRTRRRPTTRADALRRLRKRQAEMGTGRLVGPDIERTTFEDLARMLVTDYTVNQRKSLETAQGSLKALRSVFGPAYARDITLDRLNAYVATRLGAGRSRRRSRRSWRR